MKNYLFVYRAEYATMPTGTPEEMAAMTKRWIDWVTGIGAKNNLADRGNRLGNTGHVVRANNVVTNGPYAEIKESIGGYSIVKTNSYEEAIELAKSCPIFAQGGNVEVREISEM